MSMCICSECSRLIDSDDDPDVFVEVGNMRRLHTTKIMCEPCRERYFEELDDHEREMYHEAKHEQSREP